MGARIHILYSNDDDVHVIQRIISAIKRHFNRFGRQDVAAYNEQSTRDYAMEDCVILIVVLGQQLVQNQASLRLFAPIIQYALTHKVLVVPVMLEGVQMPTVQNLPRDIQALAQQQNRVIQTKPSLFAIDIKRIFTQIETQTTIRYDSLIDAWKLRFVTLKFALLGLTMLIAPVLFGLPFFDHALVAVYMFFGASVGIQALLAQPRKWGWFVGMSLLCLFGYDVVFPSGANAHSSTTSDTSFPEKALAAFARTQSGHIFLIALSIALVIVAVPGIFYGIPYSLVRLDLDFFRITRFYRLRPDPVMQSGFNPRIPVTSSCFISYRRTEFPNPVDQQVTPLKFRIYKALRGLYDTVFLDVDTILAGANFPLVSDRTLSRCEAVLVFIGPTWVTVKDAATGRRRLDNSDDFVRLEVAQALAQGKIVVPVLIDHAAMPDAAELPPDMRALTTCTPHVLHDDSRFADDMNNILKVLRIRRSERRINHPFFPVVTIMLYVVTTMFALSSGFLRNYLPVRFFEVAAIMIISGYSALVISALLAASRQRNWVWMLGMISLQIILLLGLTRFAGPTLLFSYGITTPFQRAAVSIEMAVMQLAMALVYFWGTGVVRLVIESKDQSPSMKPVSQYED